MSAAPREDVVSLVDTHRATLSRLVEETNGTEASRLLARRAAALATWCDATELLMANGRQIDMSNYLRAVGSLQQLLADAAASIPMHDITPRDQSPRDLARAVLYMHHKAKDAGTVHLLPPAVLDLIATVPPTPEPAQ
ncbi:MAG: hypothetical protein EOR97_28200 [Mesorhizobium sp.]|uniref:hypothetical protein n=1 Tax=Mesorhizobium sp. TaxID=1871066 RepID=UPI000FE5806A|nr:hypothetical protein [Mesorhizobium sp.]RWN26528.1 MAG: hypothetical protein EOR97_28200 [Mesorhizobium sp.]